MLWTVKQASHYLDLEPHQVYYLLAMRKITAVKVGKLWRLEPEAVKEYDRRFPKSPHRKSTGNFIYPGNNGLLFDRSPDCTPPDPDGEAAGVEGRRKQLVHKPRRHQASSLAELKPVVQLELFTA
jgi:excisionase family DNA binding protein